jgi:hypothetical protein
MIENNVALRLGGGETLASAGKKQLKSDEGNPDDTLRCHRCGSLMIFQKFYGHHEVFWGQRCICCGDIVDPITMENRIAMAGRSLRRQDERIKQR